MATVFEGIFGEWKPEELPEGINTDVATDWEDILKAKRDKIKARLSEVIPDEAAYQSRIAEVATEEFSNVLNPNYYKTERAFRKFKIKVKKGGSAWLSNVESAFAEGGRFDTGVTANKQKFINNILYTLRFTGDMNKVWGCVPKAIKAIEGKGKVLEKIKGTVDSITGSPVPMFKVTHLPRIKALLANVFTEGLVMARMGKEAGEVVDDILAEYNAIIADYISATFLDESLDPTASSITLEYDSVADRLSIHVVEATP
ncbi:MAG: hypothetical protein DRP74_08840 [Candidatus Omnitrophota bacterium]|nr:MAG: hypothetical protein DRP74_08840 [Candidatus Omnitrophota bacterium]